MIFIVYPATKIKTMKIITITLFAAIILQSTKTHAQFYFNNQRCQTKEISRNEAFKRAGVDTLIYIKDMEELLEYFKTIGYHFTESGCRQEMYAGNKINYNLLVFSKKYRKVIVWYDEEQRKSNLVAIL